MPAPFVLSSTPITVYANAPATLTAAGLPSSASGKVVFTDASTTLATVTIMGTSVPSYEAFGDSITAGSSYAGSVATNYGLALSNYAIGGAIACDVLPSEILANGIDPSYASTPLSSLMIGSNDAVIDTPAYDVVFNACQEGALAWLAVPRESKILAGDAGVAITSGTWIADATNFNTFTNTTGGTVRYNIATAGAPIYIWQLLSDSLGGTFNIAVDGVPNASLYSTQTNPAIASRNTPQLKTFGLIRLPAAPGPHTVDFAALSGTVGILAVATPSATIHPTILVTDVPNQLPGNSAAIAQYTQDIRANVTLLAGDGLDLRLVPTQTFMLGTTAEMFDAINPNALGQSHIAAAFGIIPANVSTLPFTIFTNTSPTASATFANPGTHTLVASYSGDITYAATTASTTITVLPQQPTLTALATPATHAYAGSPVTFTATVSPTSATGTITFYDGTQLLAQLPLVSRAAIFSTTTLTVGIHNLIASYSGDLADTSSASPQLAIDIVPTPTTLTLAPIPVASIYGTATVITATIAPASATGTITFFDASQAIGHATIANGVATFNATLSIGAHSITASYSGDISDQPTNSGAVTTTIQAISTATTLSPPSATTAFGSTLTLTGQVSPATATGTITFRDASSGILGQAPLINGSASMTTSTLALGTHSISATYPGDATHSTSVSVAVSAQIVANATSTTLGGIPPTITAGSAITLNAQVAPATATGTILFRDVTAGVLGQGVLINGVASLTLSSLAAGHYSITAQYSGDSTDAPSVSSAITTQITIATTTTTLMQPLSALYSAPVTLTANVTPVTASGVIQFSDASGVLATTLLVNGTASAQLTMLTTGTHVLHASYLGDTLNASSTSASALTIVTPDTTSTTLTLAQTTVPAGGIVVFNVRVANALTNDPTGTVTVSSGTTVLASGTLTNASNGAAYATLSVNATALGTTSAIASYSGDANDLASYSVAVNFTIVPTPTTATLTLSAASVPPQSAVTLTAVVASATQIPTGSIVFACNGNPIATVPLNPSGVASTTFSSASIGAYAVTASFVPTGLFAATTAPPQTLTVTPPVALTLVPSVINTTPGAASTATLTITPLAGFSGSVRSQCQSPMPYITCTVDAPTSLSSPVHITIPASLAASIFPFAGVLLVPLVFRRRRHRNLLVVLLAIAVLTSSSCAEGGDFFDIPTGSQAVALNVTAAGVTVTTTLTVNIGK